MQVVTGNEESNDGPIEHAYLLFNAHYFLYIDYQIDHAFSTLLTKVQPVQHLCCINVITEVL